MTKPEEKMTVGTFEEQYPDVFETVHGVGHSDGVKEQADLFAEFTEQFSDDPAFLVEQFAKGASLNDAIKAQNVKLKEASKNKPEKTKEDPDKGSTEFSDKADDPDKQGKEKGPQTFNDAVKAYAKDKVLDLEDGKDSVQAYKYCTKNYPDLHEKMANGE